MKVWNKNNTLISTNSEGKVEDAELVAHMSFVDCPGHAEIIKTLLSSISLMHGVIIVVSAAEPLSKKPQLIQHLAAVRISKIKNIVIIFNKLDLITKEQALERKLELDEMLEKLEIKPTFIIPCALNKKIGLDNVLRAMVLTFVKSDKSDNINHINDSYPEFRITRSFDINKPGINWDKVSGGVFGGSLSSGEFNINDNIEIRPGIFSKNKEGKFIVQPIKTTILSIQTDKQVLQSLYPGGLTAIGTNIDPFYCKGDKLAGSIVGLVGHLPDVYQTVVFNCTLTTDFDGNWKPVLGDIVCLQIGNTNITSTFENINEDYYTFNLSKPACIPLDTLILVCRDIDNVLRIVGYGTIDCTKSIVIKC
jgi:translation initiation factor 2 gamma subunit (eIF-2gamma)